MDTKTWIAVAAGFTVVGAAPAYATDAHKDAIAISASEKGVEKDKKETADEADAHAEKAREENAQTLEQERERADRENARRDRPINPNAI